MNIEILNYQSTTEEKRRGLSSSVKSEGFIGRINRVIARVTGEQEVDVVAFVLDLRQRKLIGPPEDFYR